MTDPTPAERYHRDAVPGAPNTPGARQAETDAGRTTGGGDGVRPWTADPTPAEIEAGQDAILALLAEHPDAVHPWSRIVAEVLRAVLPDRDAWVRTQERTRLVEAADQYARVTEAVIRADERAKVAEEIRAHADQYAGKSLNHPQTVLRRHLHIAARIAGAHALGQEGRR